MPTNNKKYAVIFTSSRLNVDLDGYDSMAIRMINLAKEQPGFLDVESARGNEGVGITVSYWENLDSIKNWKNHLEHITAQQLGKEKWYQWYRIRICQVEREYSFGDL